MGMLLPHSWNPGYRIDREGSKGGGVPEGQCRTNSRPWSWETLPNNLANIWKRNNLATILKRYYIKTGVVCDPLGNSTITDKVSRKDGIAQGNPRIFLLWDVYIIKSSKPQGSSKRLEVINTRTQSRD